MLQVLKKKKNQLLPTTTLITYLLSKDLILNILLPRHWYCHHCAWYPFPRKQLLIIEGYAKVMEEISDLPNLTTTVNHGPENGTKCDNGNTSEEKAY